MTRLRKSARSSLSSFLSPLSSLLSSLRSFDTAADDYDGMTALPSRVTFFARQPIVDRRRVVVGYEMLFRGDWSDLGEGGANSATAQALCAILLRTNRSSRPRLPIFVNFTHDVLVKGLGRVLTPPRDFVVEILESVEPDERVLEECRRLRASGLRIALDDVIDDERLQAFANAFDIAKVDLLGCAPSSVSAMVSLAHRQGAKALAEKVENEEAMADALDQGFDYFQGFGLGRPRKRPARLLRGIPSVYLKLLELLAEPEPSLPQLGSAVESDETLAYKVLRFANSAQAAQCRPIDSIRSALVLLGQEQLRLVVALALISGFAEPAPQLLLEQSLVRSRFCEFIGERYDGSTPTSHFLLAGLLSNLHELLGVRSIDEAIAPLSLPGALADALVAGEGDLGAALALVRAYEAADWQIVDVLSSSLQIDASTLPEAYASALQTAAQIVYE